MIRPEKEAKTLTCHKSMGTNMSELCIGSACMAWCDHDAIILNGETVERGYCGLVDNTETARC